MTSNNNTLIFIICFALLSSCTCTFAVVFSEVMPSPAFTEEWIELYNESLDNVDISGWEIVDVANNRGILPDSLSLIPPFGYAVIAKNLSTLISLSLDASVLSIVPSHWAALNNDSDRLVLYDIFGISRDQMQYGEKLTVTKGRSFERIFKTGDTRISNDWGLCAALDGHTAGRENSLQPVSTGDRVKIWAEPNPFSPDNDGRDDLTDIHFIIPGQTTRITIEIFDLYGRSVRRLVSNIPAGTSSPVIQWDGGDDQNKTLPIGRYILVLESIDSSSGKTFSGRSTVVIAGQLR